MSADFPPIDHKGLKIYIVVKPLVFERGERGPPPVHLAIFADFAAAVAHAQQLKAADPEIRVHARPYRVSHEISGGRGDPSHETIYLVVENPGGALRAFALTEASANETAARLQHEASSPEIYVQKRLVFFCDEDD